MKKLLALVMVSVLSLSLVACGSETETTSTTTSATPTTATTTTATATPNEEDTLVAFLSRIEQCETILYSAKNLDLNSDTFVTDITTICTTVQSNLDAICTEIDNAGFTTQADNAAITKEAAAYLYNAAGYYFSALTENNQESLDAFSSMITEYNTYMDKVLTNIGA